MATPSIFTHVKITVPKKAELFVDALEASKKAQVNKPSAPSVSVLKNLDEIRKLMAWRKTAR